jgi:hypothetical protein
MENGKEIHIGVDVSKATLDISDGSRFERIDNDKKVVTAFLREYKHCQIRVSAESTGPYHKVLAKDKRISSSQTLPHQREGLCNSNYCFSISGKRETIFANVDTSWS